MTDYLSGASDPAPDPESVEPESVEPESVEPGSVRHATVVAIANQKGGVGKSTTAINLGAGLALQGERIRGVFWWAKGWRNGWGPKPTIMLPLSALMSSAIIVERFLAAGDPNRAAVEVVEQAA